MLPEFLVNYAYYAFKVMDIFAGDRLASTIPHLTKERLQKLPLPVPPLAEQAEVVQQLDALWDQMQRGEEELKCLARLKSGLLQDLLTGAVRVTA